MTAPIDIPDLLDVDVPIGGRVLVVADLHLTAEPNLAQVSALAALAGALEAATGPGVLVIAGNLFDSGCDLASALSAHPQLSADISAFGQGPGRKVVVLPGDRDSQLAWSGPDQALIETNLNAVVALSADLHVHTAAGVRKVRVEPGHSLDALARFDNPRNPGESPFGQHIRRELLPSVRRHQTGSVASDPGWLSGMEQLDEPAALSRFIASRLVYRRLGRSAWLLVIPVIVALILRLPTTALRSARHGALTTRLGIFVAATFIEVVLIMVVVAVALRRTNLALSALALDDQGRDPNDAPRARGRDLVTSGYAGLISAHTCRPELTHLGRGFYANAGSSAEVVTEYPSRLPGLGLPSVFLGHRQLAWVEVDAGNEVHVRLLHGRQDLPGASVFERVAAKRTIESTSGPLRAQVVAAFPQGEPWPRPPSTERKDRRVRRTAAAVVVAFGFLSLVAAFSDPVRDRLNAVRDLFPLFVPETAAALAALAGVGLIVLARGIRRGQRRAWVVCQLLLLTTAVLHLLKGIGVEATLVALAVAFFLWLYRDSFRAKSDVVELRRGVLIVLITAAMTLVAGTLAVELSTTANHTRGRYGISWWRAFQASAERMVGVTHVALPHAVDRFLDPALATVSVGLALAVLAMIFRPVVLRRQQHALVGPATPTPHAGDTADLARAREVVARHGAGTLDYFALRPDKQFFFWGETVVAFAVYGGVCLVSPDPIGPVAEREQAWREFRRFVDAHGWALGGLGAGEDWLPIYRATGMHDLYVGDEGVVRVARFTLEGGKFKGLRQAVNRIAKYGYRITFHDPARLDPQLRQQLQDVMTKSRRGDVERGFSMTLGRAFDPADAGLLLAVVHGPGPEGNGDAPLGEPVAFCQYVPAPGIGGYSLDLMRRDNGEHPNGLIDFAVVETIRELKRRGDEGLGLNFATMRAVLAGEAGEGVTQRVQAWMLKRMGDSMQIESLWKFNAKFDPDWQPRYAVYDAPENMFAVAIAVARAESFWELPVIGRFLVPTGAPGPEPAPAPPSP